MKLESIKLNISNYVANVSFNRPERANSLHLEAWDEMKMVFNALAEDPKVRVIVLTGEGSHFCAGMDLETLMSLPQTFNGTCESKNRERIRKFILYLQGTINSIEECKKPVIAAIQKACIGGGLNIVSACDIRYCTSDAFFSIAEVDLGLVADIGVLQRLPKSLNPMVVSEMAYTGRKMFGPEAHQIGLVAESFDSYQDMMIKVDEVAKVIASKPPTVIQGTKEMLLYARDHSVHDSLQYMASWNAAKLLSNDLAEAMTAHMEKREALYEDF